MALSKQENGAPITIIAVNKTNSFKQQTHQLENTPTQELTNLATHQLTNPPTRSQDYVKNLRNNELTNPKLTFYRDKC